VILTNDGTDAIVGTFANGSSVKAAYNNVLYTFRIDYATGFGSNDISITALSAINVLGDYDSDGIFDARDYVVWRQSLNMNVIPYFGADGNGDGVVTDADYQIWRSNYGRSAGAGAGISTLADSASVPEPGPIVLL